MGDPATMSAALPRWTPAVRYFRTPKGLLLLILAATIALAGAGPGWMRVAPGLAVAGLVAMLLDAPVLRWRKGRWVFPDGALLTGLIVAMVLSPIVPLQVVAVTSAVAIASKHLVRTHTANVFNPAAFGIVATFLVYDTAQDWWGAMPGITPWALVVLVGTGWYITARVNKLPLLLTFLGVYFLLFTATAFLGGEVRVAEIFREPDLHAVLFFALFMLTDPPTSPARPGDQAVFGIIAAVSAYAVYQWLGAVYFLLAGLLVANLWEGWRRLRAHTARRRQTAALRSSP